MCNKVVNRECLRALFKQRHVAAANSLLEGSRQAQLPLDVRRAREALLFHWLYELMQIRRLEDLAQGTRLAAHRGDPASPLGDHRGEMVLQQ